MSYASPVTDRLPREPSAAQSGPARDPAENRRHLRFEMNLLGRFMRADKQEYPCRLIDLSVGGAAFLAPVAVNLDERIVAYLDQIGGVEGYVVRAFDGGFALKFNASLHKREKIAAQITWLINRSELDGIEARRPGHERVTSDNKSTIMRLMDDQEFDVTLLDVSISGASVITTQRPPLGMHVTVGKLRALVVRHHGDGVGVQFLDIQNPDALRRYFG